jgi:DNA-binding NarL/FixJ family response regulator
VVRIFVVFRDTIYVRGLQSTLVGAAGVESVDCATSIALAWEHEALLDADVVVLDSDLGGAVAFVGEIGGQCAARVLLCLGEVSRREVLEALGNGVGGVLSRDSLTPDRLLAAVGAVAAGILALDAGVLGVLDGSAGCLGEERRGGVGVGFAPREQMVLRLVAAGLSNREIAQRLSYSERTIKTILHDVVVKLGVKSRSQAVAMAVRERMI